MAESSSIFLMEDEHSGSAEEHLSSHTSDHDEEVHHHVINDFGIGTLVLAMTLGTAARMYLTHMTGLPYTVVVLLLGLVFGVVLHSEVFGDLDVVGDSLLKWTDLSPEVILFVFLPILLFESAFNTDVHIFQREFWQVLTLAGPGVAIATTLSAIVLKYVFPYEWGWDEALMMGGMLSATDPVAVVALLKELGVSERLSVLIEGESLLNDATGIVVFVVFRDAFVGAKESSPLSVLETAARMSLGGPVIGFVLGTLGSFSLGYIIDDALTEITLTVIVCFSAFMISEATELEVSGVLAVVTTGLVMSSHARGRISPGVEETMHTFWSVLTYVANTVIFFVSGLIIGHKAVFDDQIEAREWGLLGLLYLSLQFIRFFVVLVLLPVLTRGGYGMSYKQLAVLAFAGLRGAVGLTLALIVVEDDRIDEGTRSLVLFYVAGIATMTLVINGSLSGPLVSYLGLDRSTTAETEVFTRACSAIETRLEHKLDLLKGDRFLGDADWEIVWRYIPVSTGKSYWHRIRHGNVNLSQTEEEDIHAIAQGRAYTSTGWKGELEHRAHDVRKWFTRRLLRLPGGLSYDELPRRLRATWYSYHKSFHMDSVGATPEDAELHRRDMELHRIHAEPHMVLDSEAWSNLNDRSDSINSPRKKLPASSTLRDHLDHVGMASFGNSTGMLSSLGQPGAEDQPRKYTGSMRRFQQKVVTSTTPAVTAAAAPSKSLVGGGGVDALRAVDGVKKLKEDRRRAAQAVAKAEARLTRLKKDMGLMKHKGEEAEMAASIQQAKGKGLLSNSSTHTMSTVSSSTMHNNRRSSMPHSASAASLHSLGRERSRVTMSTSVHKMSSGAGIGAGGSHGAGGGVRGDAEEEKMPYPDGVTSSQAGGRGSAASPTSLGSSDGDDIGLPMDDSHGADGDGPGFPEASPALLGHSGTMANVVGATGGRGNVTAEFSSLEGDGHAVPSNAAVSTEWNPYEDSDDEGVDGTGTSAMRKSRGGGGSDAGIGPGAVTTGSMSEARVRFLTAVKAHFLERYRQGWLSSMGFRVLKENMDAQLDYDEREMEQWHQLSSAFKVPRSFSFLRRVPIFGSILESYMYRRLTFIFELASNFISAHEDVDILELLNEGPVAYQLALEKNRQLKDARATLAQQLPVFPELARSLKTRVAARYMLVQHRDVVHELFHHGHINEKECENLIAQNNEARVKLEYHPHADEIPDRMTLLKNVPFLRFLSEEDKAAIINDEKACKEEFYGSNVVLMEETTGFAKGRSRAGWFNVVRGAVRQTTEGLLDHKSTGGTTRTRRLAKERLVNAGTVIGLDEQLLEAPYKCTYVTSSFVHLFFFDKAQMLILADHYPALKRGLWWLLASSVVRHHHGFRMMDLAGVYQLMRTAEFKELKSRHATLAQDSRHGGRRSLPKITSNLNLSRHNRSSPTRKSTDSASSSRPAIVRAAASLNESRHKLSKGLRLSVNRTQLHPDESLRSPEAPGLRLFLEEESNILLLRGVMRKREATTMFGHIDREKAVTIVRDVSGPIEFTEGSVMFIMPAILLSRASSSHQLLMREVEQRHRAVSFGRPGGAPGREDSADMIGTDPSVTRWQNTSLSASGGPSSAAPRSPSRGTDALMPLGAAAEPSMIDDISAGTADESADPSAHPAILRRKRTLRDAQLAAKAVPCSVSMMHSANADAVAAAASAAAVAAGGGGGSFSASMSGRSLRESSSGSAGASGHTVTRMELSHSRRHSGGSVVEMTDVPLPHVDEDSARSSRVRSAVLYPDTYAFDSYAHANQLAHRLEEDRLEAQDT